MRPKYAPLHGTPRAAPPLWLAPLYGVINGLLLIPVSISFTSIIFSSPFFAPYLPHLVRLVLLSSMLHQCAFSCLSSLPFAVGQVQDAGLVFLSAMSSSTVQSMQEAEADSISIMSTVLVELSLATLLLGVCLVLLGKLQLASVVQYLPVPVIGGYLAFIGFFCGRAGLELMAGPLPAQWLPGCIVGGGMYALLRRFRSPWVLPVCMLSTLAVFYTIVVMSSGWDLQDARKWGWINPLENSVSSQHQNNQLDTGAGLFRLEAVHWHELPRQVPCWIGMVFVVAFSSSLDVCAIEMELGLPLDNNREIVTVGWSNVLSGLFGGYTGSYIFSQTLFTMRRGIFTRTCGLFIVLFELAVVLMPVSITAYVPKLFFGSLLILIALDLLFEWLIFARSKMMGAEYAVVLLTFFAILLVGIEGGLALGVLFASVGFVFSFASIAARVVPSFKSSNVLRTFEERSVLIEHRTKIVTLSLQGYVFYGSAVKILEDVKAHVVLRSASSTTPSDADFESTYGGDEAEEENALDDGGEGGGKSAHVAPPSLFVYTPVKRSDSAGKNTEPINKTTSERGGYGSLDDSVASPNASPMGSPPGSSSLSVYDLGSDALASLHRRVEGQASSATLKGSTSLLASVWSSQSDFREAKKTTSVSQKDPNDEAILFHEQQHQPQQQHKTEFLVLDFTTTIGVDATAAKSCFLMLSALMRASGVTVVFANLSVQIKQVLQANGVVKQHDVVIPRLDDALEWCEEQLLARELRQRDSGLARDKSYYAIAWQRRHGLAVPAGDGANSELRLEASVSNLSVASIELTSTSAGRLDTSPGRAGGVSEDARELAAHARCLRRILEDHLESSAASNQAVGRLLSTQLLVQFFERRCVVGGEIVCEIGSASEHIFLLEEGEVELCCVNVSGEGEEIERINKICSGGIFGEAGFFLGVTCSLRALALCPCSFWTLSREAYSRMETEQPRMCLLIQHLLLKSLSISHVANLYKLAPETAYSDLFVSGGGNI